MASSGGASGSGGTSWQKGAGGQLGSSRGNDSNGGHGGNSERSSPISPAGSSGNRPPPVPPHSHRYHRDRERNQGTTNHETVCNMLSMLTLEVDHHQQHPQFASNSGSSSQPGNSTADNQRMLLINMANSPESCKALRRAGCIPLLVELIHPRPSSSEGIQPPEIIRLRAEKALKNIVNFNPDEKMKRKELRVLKLLEGIRLFSDTVKALIRAKNQQLAQEVEAERNRLENSARNVQHPNSNITTLMKLSFDEEHRSTMCLLGAIHALADLIVCDHLIHGNNSPELQENCLHLRRYSAMTLTNLTFGDGINKAILSGMREFLNCMVAQLEGENEDIRQVTASILRNLSWRSDAASKASLQDSEVVSKLTIAAINSTKESTLKATLSALWNLSAHSSKNKSAICLASPNALAFLISLMRPNNPLMKQMKTPMAIIDNAGGILRNIASQISCSPELRKALRENHCYEILLEHLKSSSLSIVSNACGTLWDLSTGTDCEEDQRKLLDLNAVPMLKSLVYSKHAKISHGASAALRNLLSSRFAKDHTLHLDSRLTAQIYSPTPGERGNYINENQKSPGSDTELDMEFDTPDGNLRHPHPQLMQKDPPEAHQQSSAAAASVFQQRTHFNNSIINKPPPICFHNHPPFPQNTNAGFRHRPATVNYSTDQEPLDLTMTSANSSPIHVISAAEFGNHSMQHRQRLGGGANNIGGAFYRPKSQNQNHSFLNAPNLIHQTEGPCTGSLRKYSFPGAKFNQSCPEILFRLQQNVVPSHQMMQLSQDSKPVDHSSTSVSTTSSTRGAGEAVGIQNDSHGGDTTFNYSLKFSEAEVEDDSGNSHNNANSNAKSEDTVKTYCYEGTPHNFSISNSCQDLVQELEYEKQVAVASNSDSGNCPTKANKLQPIDEVPKAYYVENTPAVFSRTSSLSSINSLEELNGGENQAEFIETSSEPSNDPIAPKEPHQNACSHNMSIPPQPMPRKKHFISTLQPPIPPRVTFSAEETPLMFSRCSSVSSLDSLDGVCSGGGAGTAAKNDDDLSDYSRRASEVVSPSDLPDSPRALAPPVRIFDQQERQKGNQLQERNQKKQEDEDAVRVFTIEEKSGLNSCRSLSPLTVDGEELPVIGKGKLDSKQGTTTESSNATATDNKVVVRAIEPTDRVQNHFIHSSSPIELNESTNQTKSQSNCSKVPIKPYDDELKVFAMEGTPFYGVSNATSLSDLTMDMEGSSDIPTGLLAIAKPVANVPKVSQPNAPVVSSTVNQAEKVQAATKPEGCNQQEVNTNQTDEPIYSDLQLLEKCIRVGKAMGIPKSQSEFRIGGDNDSKFSKKSESTSNGNLMTLSLQEDNKKKSEGHESKSQDFDFDDPDLAALIMIGRNRSKDKEKSNGKSKLNRSKSEKEKISKPVPNQKPEALDLSVSSTQGDATSNKKEKIPEPIVVKENVTEKKIPDETAVTSVQQLEKSVAEKPLESDSEPQSPKSAEDNILLSPQSQHEQFLQSNDLNQISTTSLGSEWNDETPTFSSPIPSMSISTAFRLAGSTCGDSSTSNPAVPKTELEKSEKQKANNMNASSISMSLQYELLENIDPPSSFSNLVSSTDCFLPQSPQLLPRSQNSTLSDRMNKKWKALTEAGNMICSTQSNLSGQRPPPDFDLENSMISVASIKSEIYELSSASINNEIFESAVEDLGGPDGAVKPSGDTSLGGNTYTIFPPENANRLTGAKSTDLSDGGNTIVSEDFTDAEDIEDFETAPADDLSEIDDQNTHNCKPEKSDVEKEISAPVCNNENIVQANPERPIDFGVQSQQNHNNSESGLEIAATSRQLTQKEKPLMEVHPLDLSNKYNTFVVKKSPMSPRASPKQKRREDPDRYRTRTINPINTGKSLMSGDRDANGNPDLKFATFRVGGPKIIKPGVGLQNVNSTGSDTSNSPESTPGHSPKGIRGRRRPLYSSLPPSAIIRKKTIPPPVPPKPTRTGSPARSTTSSTSVGGIYVRPTRTTELRSAANNSRDNSPRRGEENNSRTSSNSSLNLIPLSSRVSDTGIPIAAPRPKVAPKPPARTTTTISTANPSTSRGFVGSTASMQIKVSNSSFGFGQQAKVADSGVNSNMKGYSTLPKSSKLSKELPFSAERYSGESKESIPGSEKSSKSGIGKITNLWRKMDFRGNNNHKESNLPIPISQHNAGTKNGGTSSQIPEKKSTGSKFSNLFGRNKNKDKSSPKPFRESPPVTVATPTLQDFTINPYSGDSASSTTGGVWVRRDGEKESNKILVPPFNYTPPGQKISGLVSDKIIGVVANTTEGLVTNSNVGIDESNSTILTTGSNPTAGSAKITTV